MKIRKIYVMTDLEGVAGVLDSDGHIAHAQNMGYLDLSVNGVSIGEFGQFAMRASELGIPCIFGSGDLAFTKEAQALVPGIETVSVKRGLRPVSDAEVRAQMLLMGSSFCSPPEWDIGNVRTDEQGKFKLADLPAKDVILRVWKEGYSPVEGYSVKAEGKIAIVMERPGVIVGRVLDGRTGKPVTKFNVKLNFSNFGSGSGLGMLYSAGKDFGPPDGRFSLTGLSNPSRYAVLITAEGYAPKRIDPVDTRPEDAKGPAVVAHMDAGLTISGIVADADSGRPMPEAEVFLVVSPRPVYHGLRVESLDDPSDHTYTVQKGRSDSTGRFEFARVEKDQHLVLAARQKEYALTLLWPVHPKRQNTLRLARGGRIAGTAKGYPGLILEKADVSVRGDLEHPRVKLADDYTFQLENVPPGNYGVCLRQEYSGKRNVQVKVEPGKAVFIDYANIPGRRIYGRVTCGGKSLAGVGVRMNWSLAGDWVVGGDTDGDGRFSFTGVSPGEYQISADLTDFRQQPRISRTRYFIVTDRDVEVNVQFSPNRIKGRVVDGASGKPIGDAYVSALRLQTPGGPPNRLVTLGPDSRYIANYGSDSKVLGLRVTRPIRTDGADRGSYGVSGEDGSFEVKNVEPGTYRLSVQAPDGAIRHFTKTFLVKPGQETTNIEVRTDTNATLHLKVVDVKTGKPIAKAALNLCATDGCHLASSYRVKVEEGAAQLAVCGIGGCGAGGNYQYKRMETDSQGLLTVPCVQKGEYGVWVIAPGYAARWVSPVPAQVGEGKPFVIKLEPTGSVLLRPAAGLLAGTDVPYLIYRIRDSKDRVVFPGGELLNQELVESGAAGLFGKGAGGYKLDVLPPGRYTIDWEVHRGYEGDPMPRPVYPPAVRGRAKFEVKRGAQRVVRLGKM